MSIPANNQLEVVPHTAEAKLSTDGRIFSAPASAAAEKHLVHYRNELFSVAERIAARNDLDIVSERHVSEAAAQLTSTPKSKRGRLYFALGGALFGAAISEVIGLAKGEPVSFATLVLAVALVALGTFLLAYNYDR